MNEDTNTYDIFELWRRVTYIRHSVKNLLELRHEYSWEKKGFFGSYSRSACNKDILEHVEQLRTCENILRLYNKNK